MSLTSYRAAPPRVGWGRQEGVVLGRPGNDLLSRVLRHSTIGAEEFNGRVRDGIGFFAPRSNHRTSEAQTGKGARCAPLTFSASGAKLKSFSSTSTLRTRQGPQGRPAARARARNSQADGRPRRRLRPTYPIMIHSLQRTWIMRAIKPIERLVPVSSTRHRAYTPGLSTWSSSTALIGSTRFEVGFPLRCLQRLSRPYIAMLHCGWRHNSSTRGTSIPVLSY